MKIQFTRKFFKLSDRQLKHLIIGQVGLGHRPTRKIFHGTSYINPAEKIKFGLKIVSMYFFVNIVHQKSFQLSGRQFRHFFFGQVRLGHRTTSKNFHRTCYIATAEKIKFGLKIVSMYFFVNIVHQKIFSTFGLAIETFFFRTGPATLRELIFPLFDQNLLNCWGIPRFFGKIMFCRTKFRELHPKSRKLVPAKISSLKV